MKSNFAIKSPSVSVCLLFSSLPLRILRCSLSGYEADAAAEAVRPRRHRPQGQALHQPPPAAPAVSLSSASPLASPRRYLFIHTHTHTSNPNTVSSHLSLPPALLNSVLTDTNMRHTHSPPGQAGPHPITSLSKAYRTLCKHLSVSHASL